MKNVLCTKRIMLPALEHTNKLLSWGAKIQKVKKFPSMKNLFLVTIVREIDIPLHHFHPMFEHSSSEENFFSKKKHHSVSVTHTGVHIDKIYALLPSLEQSNAEKI